eukprot:6383805-Amphidinium_carterae.2
MHALAREASHKWADREGTGRRLGVGSESVWGDHVQAAHGEFKHSPLKQFHVRNLVACSHGFRIACMRGACTGVCLICLQAPGTLQHRVLHCAAWEAFRRRSLGEATHEWQLTWGRLSTCIL